MYLGSTTESTLSIYSQPDISVGLVEADPKPPLAVESQTLGQIAREILKEHMPDLVENKTQQIAESDLAPSALRAVIRARHRRMAKENTCRILAGYANAAAVYATIHQQQSYFD